MAAEPLPGPAATAEKTKKRLLVSFAGTVVIGLAMAGWYVGDRIYAADAQAPVRREPVIVLQPANIPLPVPPREALVIPGSAPYYLQTQSLDNARDMQFLNQLQEKGYNAWIDSARPLEIGRILIGPYSDKASLEGARRKLADDGILAQKSAR